MIITHCIVNSIGDYVMKSIFTIFATIPIKILCYILRTYFQLIDT